MKPEKPKPAQTIDEEAEVIKQLVATSEIIGTAMSPTAATFMAGDLNRFPFLVVCDALRACRERVRGKLTMHDVMVAIQSLDGRLGRDEAWGLALQSADEHDTVVWTTEIRTAFDAARSILSAGDKVAARMAFMSAYDRLVTAARAAAEPVEWVVSLGSDKDLRQRAIESAVKLQRLPTVQAEQYAYLSAPVTADGRAIAGLLTGSSNRGLLALTSDEKTRAALLTEETSEGREASPEVKERLRELREAMVASSAEKARRRQQLIDGQRRDLEQRKQRAQEQVDSVLRGEVAHEG